jgi:DNA polymerase-3 subunit gamma/tau
MAKAKSEYTVVARRYRPQQFDELIGQEAVAQALKNAVIGDRVAHAYLFTGARGVGKTSAARILAKALNCVKGPTPTPCDKCSSCEAIAAGDDIDVREIDGASNRGIDDVRAIRQDVSTRPARSRYKIYIIDEVHMLTKESFNALLKTLEEPPPHVKFIFATTEVQKVPITILSRCQRFDFILIRLERIAAHLRSIVAAEKMMADDEALEIIARRAAGSMRDGQSLLDQLLAFGGDGLTGAMVQKLLGVAGPERVAALADAIFRHNAKQALEMVIAFAEEGLQLAELLDQLIDHWRDLMLVGCAGREAGDLNAPARFREVLFKQAEAVDLDTILAGLDILVSTKNRLRGSGHVQILLQMAIIRLCRLEDLASLSQLALWVSGSPVSGDRPPSPPSARPSSSGLIAPPEAKKKAEPAELSAENLHSYWPEILAQLGPMLGGLIQRAGTPAIFGPNSVVIAFPVDYNGFDSCARPENVQRIENALLERTGRNWTVRIERKPVGAMGSAATANGKQPGRLRPQEAMQQFPLLAKALEVFGALPINLDQKFGDSAEVSDQESAAEPDHDEA